MNFWNNNGTKILGYLTTALATVAGLISIGAFNGLLEETTVRWMAIAITVLTGGTGLATAQRGHINTAQVKIATAMETAIKAQPPAQGGFVRPLVLALLLAIAVPTMLALSGCATNPDGSRELTNTGKIALQEVAAIAVSRHVRESPRAAERAQKIRAVLADLQDLPDVATVSGLRQVVQARIDERVSDPYDRQDFTRLLNILNAVLLDYVGDGQLDAQGIVRVRDFLGYVAAAIPEIQPAT